MQRVKSYGNICMLTNNLPLSDKNALSVFHYLTMQFGNTNGDNTT